jgi:hypothetical protein
MQEDCKLWSYGFTLLKQMILHVLRQIAPYIRITASPKARQGTSCSAVTLVIGSMAATPQGKRRHANAQQNATVPLRGADRAEKNDGKDVSTCHCVRKLASVTVPVRCADSFTTMLHRTPGSAASPRIGDRIRHAMPTRTSRKTGRDGIIRPF